MSNKDSRWIGRAADRLARWVRPWVPDHPGLRRRLRRLRYWLPTAESTSDTSSFMATFGRAYPDAQFIQVGANDGALHDPLRRELVRRNWRGIMIEPVPYVFERLQQNYRAYDRIALENVAIADSEGELPFYHLAPAQDRAAEGLPVWYAALGSFHKDVILSHRDLIPNIDERLVTRMVPCTTFSALCAKHSITHVDLIQIDTEGHDYEVIKLVDFGRLEPRVVFYEHQHLSPADRIACRAHLATYGFECIERHYDTLALRVTGTQARDAELMKLWSTLRNDSQSN
jgi:FkbM family methyltransferase